MLIAIMLATGTLDDAATRSRVHDGGICAGLSWVALAPGEKAVVKRGPDFDVLRFAGPAGPNDHWWGVYSGNAAQVAGNGPILLKTNGVIVRRALENGQFRGYLAQKGNWQNHFFGSVFNGTDADKGFFARIDFGARGQALCAKAG